MPSISRVPSMAALSFALPTAARWERPRGASLSLSSENAGGFAQGPEENRGLAGRTSGLCTASCDAVLNVVISDILPDIRPSLGRGVPLPEVVGRATLGNRENRRQVGTCAAPRLR